MSEKNFALIYTGRIEEGTSLEDVHQNLAGVFKTDIERIRRMFSNTRSIIKKNTDRDTCLKMQALIQQAGAICIIESVEPPVEDMAAPEPAPEPPPMPEPEPGPVSEAETNPYAAPQSRLNTETDLGITAPRKRPLRNGASWVMQGLSLYFRNPFKWAFIAIVFSVVNLIIVIPFVGIIVVMLLYSVYFAGFILGAKESDETGELRVGSLFRGFKNGFGRLVVLNIIMFVAMLIFLVVVFAIASAILGVDMGMTHKLEEPTTMITTLLVIYSLVLSLSIPFMMLYWFTPALISINRKGVFEAIGLSFKACLINWLPFLVYGLLMLGLYIAFGFVTAIVIGILGYAFGSNMVGGASVVLPLFAFVFIMLMYMPIGLLTLYTSYKDIFYEQ